MNKIFLFIIICLLAPLSVLAATGGCDMPAYFNYIINFALGASAILALTMITLGAIQMMLNSANPSAQGAGREKIKNALLGLALIFGAWLILYTINPDLVNYCNFGNIIGSPIPIGGGSGRTIGPL